MDERREEPAAAADAALDARVAILRRRIFRSLQVLALASAAALLEAAAVWASDAVPAVAPLVRWALEATGAECDGGDDCPDTVTPADGTEEPVPDPGLPAPQSPVGG